MVAAWGTEALPTPAMTELQGGPGERFMKRVEG